MKTNSNYATLIAKAALQIKAIILRPNEPFTWASGWKSPIYNDNRKHLGFHSTRVLILEAILATIRENNISCDAILGTSMSGIPWAALVARALKKPLVIFYEEQLYRFWSLDGTTILQEFDFSNKEKPLLTNGPWGIPDGIYIANDMKIPFIYERKNRKDHGTKKKFEGNFVEGDSVNAHVFYWNAFDRMGNEVDFTHENQRKGLEDAGFRFESLVSSSVTVEKYNPAGMRILEIEDLISTGGSSAKEILAMRTLGAKADTIISIFHYGFPKAIEVCEKEGITVYPLSTYETLLPIAIQQGYISEEERALLAQWAPDPEKWSNEWKALHPETEKV